jgi:hypothetical protein
VLNAATATELADYCPFVEQAYPAPPLAAVPRDWEWIVDDARGRQPDQLELFPWLRSYYAASDEHFRATRRRGVAGSEPPAYLPHQQLLLEPPAEARARARAELGGTGPWIAVMPAGSGGGDGSLAYPSAASWELVLRELAAALPGVRFCLVGKLRRDERTSTAFPALELARLPRSCDAFDRPLADQLALVEACDLFLSPHTGFGMAALAVGTPWLTLSGGRWPEWFFNGVPFYSVLPPREAWYSFFEPPPAMMDERVRADVPELVEAARLLIDGGLSYEDALRGHFARLVERSDGDTSWLFSFDSIHERYV